MNNFGFVHEASIKIESDLHHCLFCKIIDHHTKKTLSSSLIDTTSEIRVLINRCIEDFYLRLYKDTQLVAEFHFDFDDIKNENRNIDEKHIYTILKYSDECTIIFMIYSSQKFFKKIDQWSFMNINDFYWNIAKRTYEKLEKNALKIIENGNNNRLRNKKFST